MSLETNMVYVTDKLKEKKYKTYNVRAGDTALKVKMLVAKPGDPSLMPEPT